jgi:molybdopterin molybdotransferase
VRENDQRQDYMRATLTRDESGALIAKPFEVQDSSIVTLLARADCLIVRPPFAPAAQPGDTVEILALGGGSLSL